MPTISIIIPVYNTEKYLHRCLDSVLAQNFTDYEVVIVDDGSTDSSPVILDEYATHDVRFRVFHEKNCGSSLARKFGMDKACGEWFVFLDSDDDVAPTYLSALYNAAKLYRVEIACCDMQKVDNDAEPMREEIRSVEILDSQQLHSRFFKYDFWGFWGKIYRREVFNGLYFSQYNINEDYVVMAQLFATQKNIAYIPNRMYYYRTNHESQSHTKLSPHILDEYYNKKWVLDFYESKHSKYASHAKAQLAETCIKIYNVITHDDKIGQYEMHKGIVKRCLKSHLFRLVFNTNLLLGLKIQLLKISVF